MSLWAEVGLALSACPVDPATLPASPGPSEASVLDQKSVRSSDGQVELNLKVSGAHRGGAAPPLGTEAESGL